MVLATCFGTTGERKAFLSRNLPPHHVRWRGEVLGDLTHVSSFSLWKHLPGERRRRVCQQAALVLAAPVNASLRSSQLHSRWLHRCYHQWLHHLLRWMVAWRMQREAQTMMSAKVMAEFAMAGPSEHPWKNIQCCSTTRELVYIYIYSYTLWQESLSLSVRDFPSKTLT